MRSSGDSIIWVFLAFTIIGAALTYYSWWVIQRHRRKLRSGHQNGEEHFRSSFTVIVMMAPLIGFGVEFLYFLFKTLQTLAAILSV